LERQNQQLEAFASIVSHDLRNPLNVAQGRLEIVQEECQSEHIEHIVDAHHRIETLIEDMLTLARLGDRVGETESVVLSQLVESCWQTINTADATLSIETEQTITGDESRLKQLFENLIRNAIEHGGEYVTIIVGELDDGFYIEDTGPGISAEDCETIFEVGYSTSEDGTGIGLNLVKQIVEAHGWSINVTDGTEGGARFEITGVGVR
jgi:signal transduction histidine kinase